MDWVANSVDADQMLFLIWVYTVCSGLSVPIQIYYSNKQVKNLNKQRIKGYHMNEFLWIL